MSRFTVIFDACVLYPAPLRDSLMRLAITGLFKAHWTDAIHEEWMRAALKNNSQLSVSCLQRTRELMDTHVDDALVKGYKPLIESLSLPDANDHHVLAAAIHIKAHAIITYNLKDFPEVNLLPRGVEALHPDEFIKLQMEISPQACLTAFRNQRRSLKNPTMTTGEFLSCLQKQQLPQTVRFLKQHEAL